MNTRQLQYAILLAEIGNFSQVAEKLNITQPALSKQISGLEKELGVQLFNRNSNPISLTIAGEYFIAEAKELIYKEDQLIRSMEKFKAGEQGSLDIGVTPFRSAYLMPKIAKEIRKRYPGVRIKLHEAGSEILRKEAAEGKYDFAVINLPVDESVFDIKAIEPDSMVLVVPNSIIDDYPNLINVKEVEFKNCENLPFVVVGPNQEMRQLFDKLCATNNFRPNIAAEVVGLTTAWEMTCAGVAATVLPFQFVNCEYAGEKISIIKITDKTYLRQPAVVTKKGQYISEYAEYAINLLTK